MSRAAPTGLLSSISLALAACGGSGPGADSCESITAAPLTAATLGKQTILSSAEYLAQDAYASADIRRGQALSMQCRTCHTLEKGGASIVGPNLFGMFGRAAGGAADFAYSDALVASGFLWTPRALDAWLAQPFAFLPGNRMSFPGLPDRHDRNALIAYLLQHTDNVADE
ncbi:MAG: c-type cytochrome [Woeseiaceae bacterium]